MEEATVRGWIGAGPTGRFAPEDWRRRAAVVRGTADRQTVIAAIGPAAATSSLRYRRATWLSSVSQFRNDRVTLNVLAEGQGLVSRMRDLWPRRIRVFQKAPVQNRLKRKTAARVLQP